MDKLELSKPVEMIRCAHACAACTSSVSQPSPPCSQKALLCPSKQILLHYPSARSSQHTHHASLFFARSVETTHMYDRDAVLGRDTESVRTKPANNATTRPQGNATAGDEVGVRACVAAGRNAIDDDVPCELAAGGAPSEPPQLAPSLSRLETIQPSAPQCTLSRLCLCSRCSRASPRRTPRRSARRASSARRSWSR